MRQLRMQQMWDGRSDRWHRHVSDSPAFDRIRSSVLQQADPQPSHHVVDLGAGTGFLTLALAPRVADVLAVDISPAMLEILAAEAQQRGLDHVRCLSRDLTELALADASVDLIVSSYALHHLVDPDKRALIERTGRWLRPGGRIVVADMMFGRGQTAHDRAIIVEKVRALLRKGPAGVWRIVKNLIRFGLRRGTELPAPPAFWIEALERAGFHDVRYQPILAEAGLVVGVR